MFHLFVINLPYIIIGVYFVQVQVIHQLLLNQFVAFTSDRLGKLDNWFHSRYSGVFAVHVNLLCVEPGTMFA